uniref:Uncharacterized protein n=1 Tax=Babesia gibsoni TaxID=33632 RepID=A0A6M8NXS1_BABGI|nr:hypothetical protein [Babesia gibsoni]
MLKNYKFFFKNKIFNKNKNILFFYNLKKHKIYFYNISNLYYKKLYKFNKIIYGIIYFCKYFKFNLFKIKIILFNKKNKEYVIIDKYINLFNIIKIFYK